jgi:hypothetical protein
MTSARSACRLGTDSATAAEQQQRRVAGVLGEDAGRQPCDHAVEQRLAVDVLVVLEDLAAVADAFQA